MTSKESAVAIEAAEWLLALTDGSPGREAEFAAWLKASPLHIEEFLLASVIWRELDDIDPDRRIAVDLLIAAARENVVDLPSSAAQANPEPAVARAPAWPRRSALAALALAASLAALWLVNPALLGGPQMYRTAKGEQRTVKLDDGSIAHLNTDTKLAVRYTAAGRELALLRGEALFVVEHDAARPFVVITDVATVRALGTQFDVYQRENGTRISVVQGTVEVGSTTARPAVLRAMLPMLGSTAPVAGAKPSGVSREVSPDSATPRARLAAGEQALVVSRGRIERTATADAVTQAVAWRERRLVFRDDTLAEVAREFNRYNERPIVIEDARVGERQLTGVFDADDPESLLLFLSKDPELVLEETRTAVVISTP